uniref:Uncharacterized protein n=1 Tax=Glossina palpalis gambiensis TaxID=67801 RepID=A0A1B0AWM9_9MUSC
MVALADVKVAAQPVHREGNNVKVISGGNDVFTSSFLVRFRRKVDNDFAHKVASKYGFDNIGPWVLMSLQYTKPYSLMPLERNRNCLAICNSSRAIEYISILNADKKFQYDCSTLSPIKFEPIVPRSECGCDLSEIRQYVLCPLLNYSFGQFLKTKSYVFAMNFMVNCGLKFRMRGPKARMFATNTTSLSKAMNPRIITISVVIETTITIIDLIAGNLSWSNQIDINFIHHVQSLRCTRKYSSCTEKVIFDQGDERYDDR